MVSVKEIYENIYKDSTPSWKGLDANKRGAVEGEAYKQAIRKLETRDALVIEGLSKNSGMMKMRNFGEQSMLELLAKTGIFLNANLRKQS